MPRGCGRPLLAQASARDSWTLTGKSGPVCLVGTLLLSPGSWCTQGALQQSVSPVLWKFCNQISLTFKFPNSLGLPLLDPQVGKSIVGPRTFATMRKFLWYNCSPVCGSSAQWLYGGVNGDLLLEGLCHTQVCCTQSPCPCCRPLLTHTSAGDTETLKVRSGSVFVESSGTNKVLFEPSEHLWWVWGLILNSNLTFN